MRFATSRPGIANPFHMGPIHVGPAIAAGVIALMGFYGFATAVQKAASLRASAAVNAPARDDARQAVGVGPMSSLVYAVSDRPITFAAAPPRATPRLPPPVIEPEPVAVNLVAQPLAETAGESLDVATGGPLPVPAAPSATGQGQDASGVEKPPSDVSAPY